MVVARSASGPLVFEVALRRPKYLKSIIAISSTHPAHDVGGDVILPLLKDVAKSKSIAHLFGLKWFLRIKDDFGFFKDPQLYSVFEEYNALLLLAEKDHQVSSEARAEYQRWADQSQLDLMSVSVGHDVLAMPFNSSEFERVAGIYEMIFERLIGFMDPQMLTDASELRREVVTGH